MLPRLMAEDSLRAISATSVGFGGGDGATAHVRSLQKIVDGGRPVEYANPADVARAAGVKVVREKKA